MSYPDDQKAARLEAGYVDGKRLKVTGNYPEGVAVQAATGEKIFLSHDFMSLLLKRRRGRQG